MTKKQKFLKNLIDNEIVNVQVKYIDYFGAPQNGIIQVNKHIVEQTKNVFNELLKVGFPINKISKADGRSDEQIIMENETTSYNFREVMGRKVLSKHAFGLAIDINPKVNPAKPSRIKHVYDESIQMGKITDEIVWVFKENGFNWGGEIFKSFWDSHHFEVDFKSYHQTLNKKYNL